jgi:hypothetical protein
MSKMKVSTVKELVEALGDADPDARVAVQVMGGSERMASDPNEPLDLTIQEGSIWLEGFQWESEEES